MARRITRKQLLKDDQVMEAAADFGQWLTNNWRLMVKAAVGVLILALAVSAFVLHGRQRRAEARELLSAAQQRYSEAAESGLADTADLTEALREFDDAHGRAGGRAPGPAAAFMKASTLYQLGRLEEAVETLETLTGRSGAAQTIRAGSHTLLASLYVQSGEPDRAVELLRQATEGSDPALAESHALLEIGRIEKARGRLEQAREAWQQLVDQFPQSRQAREAQQELGS